AVHEHPSLARSKQRGHQLDHGALTAAVGANQPEACPLLDPQIEVLDNRIPSVAKAEIVQFDHRHRISPVTFTSSRVNVTPVTPESAGGLNVYRTRTSPVLEMYDCGFVTAFEPLSSGCSSHSEVRQLKNWMSPKGTTPAP